MLIEEAEADRSLLSYSGSVKHLFVAVDFSRFLSYPLEDVLELGQKCSWLYEWNPRHFRASAGACDSEPQGKETVYWHHVIAKTTSVYLTPRRSLSL